MTDAKSEILGRIRASLWDSPQPAEPVRTYRRVSDKGQEEIIEILVDRLIDYKANVYHETAETIAGRIDELLAKAPRSAMP